MNNLPIDIEKLKPVSFADDLFKGIVICIKDANKGGLSIKKGEIIDSNAAKVVIGAFQRDLLECFAVMRVFTYQGSNCINLDDLDHQAKHKVRCMDDRGWGALDFQMLTVGKVYEIEYVVDSRHSGWRVIESDRGGVVWLSYGVHKPMWELVDE